MITNSAGYDRRHAHDHDQASVFDVVLRHCVVAAFDEERLLGLAPIKPPSRHTVVRKADTLWISRPHKRLVVGLKHRPLGSLIDRRFEEDEQAPDVDVLPFGIDW